MRKGRGRAKPIAILTVIRAGGFAMTNTRERVPRHTDEQVNRRIRAAMKRNVHYYSLHREEIPRRMRELEEEWDIERAIEANAAAIAFGGIALSMTRGRGWLVLPALVTGFLFQHAVQGWCPPVPGLRRLGVRTRNEIDREKYALKMLRGDFRGFAPEDMKPLPDQINGLLTAVRA